MAQIHSQQPETRHDVLQAQAQEWLVRLTSGQATTNDARAYQRWCAQSAAHAAAMAEVSRVWSAAQQAGQAFPAALRQPSPERRMRPARRAFLGGALATAVAGWMIWRPPAGLWPGLADMNADYRTATGEQRQLQFDGQIQVAMNTQTSLNLLREAVDSGGSVGAGSSPATLELLSGEAQMQLPAAAALTVLAADGRIDARSAARFNVRVSGKQACVTCMAGQVEVNYAGRVLRAEASQQITYGAGTAELAVAATAVGTLNAWRNGVLVFDNTPLAAVVEEINRYRPGKIIVTNPELGRRRVQAQVRLDQMADVVALIRTGYGAEVTTLPAGIVLLS